jgi:tripartite-type tricarboxylate transporter receptor subunit TctC
MPVSSALPHVKSGKLRILANVGSRRSPFAPDVPTLGELGYPTLDFDLWFGFLGPANLPPAIVRWWETELAAIAESPDAQEAFRRHGISSMYLDSQATGARLKSEVARWTAVAEKAGLRPE